MKQTHSLFLLFFLISIFFLGQACSKTKEKANGFDLRDQVRKITLDNGMRFLLVKREGAPVFSTQLKVIVGSIEEEPGSTGLAHFFEHMAFKGTDKIGTKDFEKEKQILDEVLKVGAQIAEMKKAGKKPEEYADLLKKRKELEAKQNEFINKNEFVQIYQRHGGRDLNASTSNDFTTYYVSLPTSKLELWAYLESERLQNRVFREFFTEVDVVAEERRMRIDNSPEGRLYETFVSAAFEKSPYQIHPIGEPEDIQLYTPQKAKEFYEKYYIPSRMVGVVVGNIDLDHAEKVIRQYFSKLPGKKDFQKEFAKETFENFPKTVTIYEDTQPRLYFGYHRPAHPHPDDIVLDVIQDLLCEGRTSRLYKKLVLEEKSVSFAGCYSSIPGARLDGLFTFAATPLAGHSNQEIKTMIKKEVGKLMEQGPTEKEMQIVKNKIDAHMVYSLESNHGLASQLAFYEALTGDWKYLYEYRDRIHSMKPEDIQKVLRQYFVESREVTGFMEREKK